MLNQPIAFVDIETTGLDRDDHEIIELGAVVAKLKDGAFVVIDTLDLKVQPKHIERAEAQALRINGYNEADWLFATTIEEAMKVFANKTEGAIFAAHNLTFDYGFIESAFKKTNTENKMHFHKLDTISAAFGVLHTNDDLGKLSLRALCEKYGIENKKAHSAFADAYALYEVFKKIMNLP